MLICFFTPVVEQYYHPLASGGQYCLICYVYAVFFFFFSMNISVGLHRSPIDLPFKFDQLIGTFNLFLVYFSVLTVIVKFLKSVSCPCYIHSTSQGHV